jgi:uncharacterized membrane protein YhaH (DUF805 family)
MNWYLAVLRNYAGFSGRARRTEYWVFTLVNAIILAVLSTLLVIGATNDQALAGRALASIAGFAMFVYWLGLVVPGLAVQVRRLHDVGMSGWWLLLGLVPIGGLVLVVIAGLPGVRGPNQFGPDPRELPAAGRAAVVS